MITYLSSLSAPCPPWIFLFCSHVIYFLICCVTGVTSFRHLHVFRDTEPAHRIFPLFSDGRFYGFLNIQVMLILFGRSTVYLFFCGRSLDTYYSSLFYFSAVLVGGFTFSQHRDFKHFHGAVAFVFSITLLR